MTMTSRGKPRPRRIAADEAHSWARNLRLNNPSAKLVLSMLTLYVDGDGTCFVGIPSLADDTELSPQTVRDRLAWLERAGAIVRSPQWVDENGRRNGDARGRRTSDLVRLLIDTDQQDLESRAAVLRRKKAAELGSQPGSHEDADPIHGTGSDSEGHPAAPPPTLRRPYDSAEGLISEPEPEPDSPLIPSGDESEPDSIGSEEPEHFGPAWLAWRGHEVMRRDLALAEFRDLAPDKQLHCRNAIPLFNAMQDQLGRTRVPNFHLWIRSRGFEEFPTAASGAPAPGTTTSFDVNTRESRAVKALYGFARALLFESGGRVVYPLPLTAQVLAFADMPDRSAWRWIEDRQQIAAWSAFLTSAVHKARRELIETRGVGAEQRRGIYAPWSWPPRKDGAISPAPGADGPIDDSEVA